MPGECTLPPSELERLDYLRRYFRKAIPRLRKIEQINNQLLKLVDVVNTADMTLDDHIERELLLMKVRVRDGVGEKLPRLIESAGARVLDDCPETYTLELTGANADMDDFITEVGSCSDILAVVRSGAMAISHGKKVLKPEF